MKAGRLDSFRTRERLDFNRSQLSFHSLSSLSESTGVDLARLPRSLRVILENLLRYEDGDIVRKEDIEAVLSWSPVRPSRHEIQFTPARVLLQDFTGVPVAVDLAAMRERLLRDGGQPDRVNPLQRVDLVIDHSVQVDAWASKEALTLNARREFERNRERYEFLKWAQLSFRNFRVVPPATGICHQVNLEFLSEVAMRTVRPHDDDRWVHPDTLAGTDSHTPMIGALGVLGWGVGGIEAEAAMLGQPCSMLIPEVVGFSVRGRLRPGVTATDLVLTITHRLRQRGVVGKFVEFTGPGLCQLSIADRATISNMAPEYGATIGYWPVDAKSVAYLRMTGRTEQAELAEVYFKRQGLWFEDGVREPEYSDVESLDLSEVEPCIAGPTRPHDRVHLSGAGDSFHWFRETQKRKPEGTQPADSRLEDGHIVIAAITSCTNTSNPELMIGAALLARNAVARGLKVPEWVKTSFAPGSKTVTSYLTESGLMPSLEALGFHLVGYGCTTCIGNSGPLAPSVASEVEERGLTVAAVLSGNRNFEARIHPLVRANYLCSPPLVVAFALAGRIDLDLNHDALSVDPNGARVFLKDIWPNPAETSDLVARFVTSSQFVENYSDVFRGDDQWRALSKEAVSAFSWRDESTYIARPPFFDDSFTRQPEAIENARILASFGDFITTDHISPAGSIGAETPAGIYLRSRGVPVSEFNSYGARRGHHEVMVRGTFANIRLRNKLVVREGGWTLFWPTREELPIYDAAMRYRELRTPLVLFAGREYGSGSSRDWAAKGTRLLGVQAVIAESFERIHRSNLVGMGVLALECPTVSMLELVGDELITIQGLKDLKPRQNVKIQLNRGSQSHTVEALCRIETENELRYYKSGGILPYVLKRLS